MRFPRRPAAATQDRGVNARVVTFKREEREREPEPWQTAPWPPARLIRAAGPLLRCGHLLVVCLLLEVADEQPLTGAQEERVDELWRELAERCGRARRTKG